MKLAYLAVAIAACSGYRPPTAVEISHGQALNDCKDSSETQSQYVKCRDEVNTKFGVDAGPFERKVK